MNASYKIVLLGAFVLFAAVVAYYVVFDDSEPTPDTVQGAELANADADPAAGQADEDAQDPGPPPTRNGLIGENSSERDRTVIVDTPDNDPANIRLSDGTGVGETDPTTREQLALADPDTDTPGSTDLPGTTDTGDTRPGPGSVDPEADPSTDLPTGTETGGTRPGPGLAETEDTDTGTTETQPDQPTTEPETGTEDPGSTDNPTPQPESDPESEPAAPTTDDTPRTYTVKPGDTFASIAVAIYGEESAWFEIAQANPSVDPKQLQVDQVIVLPRRGEIVRDREEVTPPAPGQDQTYTIRPGDNLSKIARKFYGDSEAWDLIYNRNRDKIGPRPDRLKVGMQIIIPQAFNGAE